MNTGAVILMVLVWGAILSLLTFCFYKVFAKKE